MSLSEMLFAAVSLLGLLAVRRNFTATALALAWGAGEYVYLKTGINVPIDAYWYTDGAVIAAIFARALYADCWPFKTWKQCLGAFWFQPRPTDRIVLAIFPFMWVIYLAPVSDVLKWQLLAMLAMAQFAVALTGAWNARAIARGVLGGESKPDADRVLRLAWGGGDG